MDELLSLVRDTLAFLRPAALIEPPKKAPLPPKILPKKIEEVVLPKKNEALPPLSSAIKAAYLVVRPRAIVLDKPPSDQVAQEKKSRWKKHLNNQEALLVFTPPCHPLLFDLEQAINTHLMSCALISLDELAALDENRARVIIFEATLHERIESLKERFPKGHFLEIPLPSVLATNQILKKKVWQMLQEAR